MSRLVPPLSSLVPDLPTYSFEQVARHCTPDDCWVIIHNHVYDVSKYLDKHPGGVNLVMKSAGVDATNAFEAMYHSARARGILETLKIGELDEKSKSSGGALLNPYASGASRPGMAKGSGPYGLGAYDPKKPLSRLGGPGSSAPAQTRPAIDEVAWRRYEVLSVVKLTHNTSLFRFQVPNKARLNVGLGKHLSIGVTLNGKMLKRDYTPISDEPGYFEILVKKYTDGPVSSYIHGLKVGDGALMRGLYGTLQVKPDHWNHLFMFAAGTGIAPMMPFIRYFAMAAAKESQNAASASPPKAIPKIAQHIHLVFSNKTEEDTLLQLELERCVELGKGTFTMHYVYSQSTHSSCSSAHESQMESSSNVNNHSTESTNTIAEASESSSSSSASTPSLISTHYGRVSSNIFKLISKGAEDAFQSNMTENGPLENCFALVCGPDGYVDSVKALLQSDWHFTESNFYAF